MPKDIDLPLNSKELAASFECTPESATFDVRMYPTGKLIPYPVHLKIVKALVACGVVMIKGALHKDIVKEMHDYSKEQLDAWFETDEFKQKSGGGDKRREHTKFHDTPKVSLRSTGRWEVKVPMTAPWTSAEVIKNPVIYNVARAALESPRIEIDTYSVVTSISRTPIQHWHNDAASLFPARGGDKPLSEHLPSHGIVVFTPLSDTPLEKGPTEFVFKSHIKCEAAEKVQFTLDAGVWPGTNRKREVTLDGCPFAAPTQSEVFKTPSEAGDVVLFDLRTLHRGGKNVSKENRPMMYLTYMQEWYVDAVNFHAKQSAEFDEIPKELMKLLSRVDRERYVELLEEIVKDADVDLEYLQSNPTWRKVDL